MRHVYNANGEFPGIKLKGKERYAKLYHYTSFESFVKIWLSKSLKFNSVKSVNDVIESVLRAQASNFLQAPLMKAYLDIRPQFKQISLTMDYDSYMKGCMSPCMWGYYADNKKGVCIELNYDKLNFPKDVLKGAVVYKELTKDATIIPTDVKTINQLISFIRHNSKEEFFTKHNSWKGENEYRIISRDDDFLDISNAIEAVHLTSYDSEECLFVEKLVDGAVPVKYLHYISSNGYILPVMTNTSDIRKQFEDAKNNPDNVLLKIQKQVDDFYQKHKDCYDLPLIMESFML